MVIILLCWFVVGIISIYFDYTKTLDITIRDILPLLIYGMLLGPFIGIKYIFDNYSFHNKVIFKKRR